MRRKSLALARKAAGYTQEALAEALHLERSAIIRWESGAQTPQPYLWPKLGRLLHQSPEQLRVLLDVSTAPREDVTGPVGSMLDWLDEHAGWSRGTARREVNARASAMDGRALRQRMAERARVNRTQVVQVLAGYYGDDTAGYSAYRVRCGSDETATNILTRPEWLGPDCLAADIELTLSEDSGEPPAVLDGPAVDAALGRLTAAVMTGVRMVDSPLYRLQDIRIGPGSVSGSVAVGSFAHYALTVDLMEAELFDSVASGVYGSHPLRDSYLPDIAAVLDLPKRPAFGGVVSLFAVARPGDAQRPPDYLLLLQRRSEQVLNAAGRLSVFPKAFHQPLTDLRADAHPGRTLLRELEEELFGRAEVDEVLGQSRVVAPMHRSRLSEPMRWLLDSPDVTMECTGFGLNLVSGNYEFATVVAVHDEKFWIEYGGHLEVNWESAGLDQYSSQEYGQLSNLIGDERWADEGLFAFLQGLRRLRQLDSPRVNAPEVELL